MPKTSTAPTAATAPAGAAQSASDAIETFVLARIEAAQAALWRAELSRRLLALIIACFVFVLAWLVVDHWIWAPGVIARLLIAASVVSAVVGYTYWRLWPVMHFRIRADYAARALERDHPELGHSLSSYVSLRQQRAEHPAGMLADRVIQSVGAGAAAKLRRIDALPSEATGLFPWWAATIGLIAALAIYSLASPKNSVQSLARLVRPTAAIAAPARVRISDVSPGDAEALAGRTLDVGATVKNLRKDEPVFFRWESNGQPHPTDSTHSALPATPAARDAAADQQIRLTLRESTTQRDRYVATVPVSHRAHGTQQYRIVAGDASAGPFDITIRDTPVVQIREIAYSPPAYTGKADSVSRSGAIQGIDGTSVRLSADVNRPITRAKIEFNPRKIGQDIQATAGVVEMEISPDGKRIEHAFVLRSRTRTGGVELQDYRIRVWDDAGQFNDDPIVYPIRVIEDLPPEITIVVPQQSPKDVPLHAEQRFEIHASDVDFGLAEVEIEIRRGIDLLARSTLWKEPAGKQGNQVIEYRFRASKMIVAGQARPGDVRRSGGLNVGDKVEVVAIATDNRTDTNDKTIVPGVTKSSPIVLRITAAEGSSAANQQTTDDGQSSEGQSGEGEQGDGEQGDGESGGGKSGEGQQGEGQQGEGQQGEGQQGEGQQGEGQQGEGQQGEGQQGEGQQGEGQQGEGQQGEGQQGMGEQTDGQQGEGESGEGEQGGAQQGEAQQNQGAGGQQGDSMPQRDSSAESSPADSESSSSGEKQGSPNGQPQSGASKPSPASPPQDDAEAFERIQDYVNEQENKKRSSGNDGASTGNQQPNKAPEQGAQQPSSPEQGASGETGDRQGNKNQSGKESSEMDPSGDTQTAPQDAATGADSDQSSSSPDSNNQQGEGTNSKGSESKGSESESSESKGSESSDGESSQGAPEKAGSEGADANERQDQQAGQDGQPPGNGDPMGDQSVGQSAEESAEESAEQAEQDSSADSSSKPESSETGKNSDKSDSRGEGSTAEGSPADGSPADGSPADGSAEEGNPVEGSPADAASNQPGQEPSQPTDAPSGSASEGGGVGQTGSGEGEELPIDSDLPDPVDLDYTRKATDLVLDYLDETRTDPDPELLERLKWSEQDLQRFRDRWQSIKPIDDGPRQDASNANEIEEALRSLGMRPPESAQSTRRDTADDLRGLRDSGNRRPAPAGIRDAFEAFRRGLSQPQ